MFTLKKFRRNLAEKLFPALTSTASSSNTCKRKKGGKRLAIFSHTSFFLPHLIFHHFFRISFPIPDRRIPFKPFHIQQSPVSMVTRSISKLGDRNDGRLGPAGHPFAPRHSRSIPLSFSMPEGTDWDTTRSCGPQ